MANEFRPTHEIVFTPARGVPTTYLVHLSDGSAYTRAEWESETAAAWEVRDGVWLHQGNATPGGANGTVSVHRLGNGWTDMFIAAGHATHGVGRTVEPVTTSGHYTTTDGWSVRVTWNSGRLRVDDIAYSAAYRCALRDAEMRHGVWSEDNDAEIERDLRAALRL